MSRIEELLHTVYPDQQVKLIVENINQLWDKYQNGSFSKVRVSEQDVLLITYGDQVQENGQQKLSTLHQFLVKHLESTVSLVHILPFYPYSTDDGFSVIDYYQVREDLGDWTDVKEMSGSFDLMFDAVINHISSLSSWFKGYLEEKPDYTDYFIDGNRFNHLDNVVRPRTSALIHDFDGKHVWTTFSRDQIDLNYENPRVLLHILDLLLFYVVQGAKMIRLDAIGFMWKKDGTTCIHLEETHTLIKVMRAVLEHVNPNIILVTETNVPHQENISYFGDGTEANMVYNFTLPPLLAFSILNQNTTKLQAWAKTLHIRVQNVCFFNFLASHDGIGLRPVTGILSESEIQSLLEAAESNGGKISYRSDAHGETPYEINCNYFSLLKGTEREEVVGVKRMLLAHAILLSLPGLPAIYFHSMFGLENDLEGLQRLGYNRAINRQKFKVDELEQILDQEKSVSNIILNGIKNLIAIRNQHRQFHPFADFMIQESDPRIFIVQRYHQDQSSDAIYAIFNLSNHKVPVPMDHALTNLIDELQIAKDGLHLGPYEFGWYKPN